MPDLVTRLGVSLGLNYSNAVAFGNARLDGGDRAYTREIPNGGAAGQANKLYIARGTLAGGANLDLDLAGALVDPLGQPVVFAAIMAIVLSAPESNTGDLTLGGAGSAFVGPFGAAAHTARVGQGGTLVLQAGPNGWTVTGGTGDILRIANGTGATQTYEITIVGR